MPKIKRLIIENFQSHKYTDMYLNPGFNVITGESDNGKSAILRALRWVYFNQPRGSEFIRINQSECRVHVVLQDGYTVIRERTPSKNRYIEIDPEGKQTIYEGFAYNVPDEIKKRLGIYDINIDNDTSINLILQEQLEGEFLLDRAYTGSVKAKTIGRIYSVHYIDSAIRDILRDENRLSAEIKKLEQDIDDIHQSLTQFDYLPSLKDKLNTISANIQKIENLQTKLDLAKRYAQLYKQTAQQINENNSIIDTLPDIQKLEKNINIIQKKYEYSNLLVSLKKEYDSVITKIQQNTNILSKVKNIHVLEANIQKISSLKDKAQSLIDKANLIKNINDEIKASAYILSCTQHLSEASDFIQKIAQKINTVQQMKNINKEYKECIRKLLNLKLTLQQTHSLDQAKLNYSNLETALKRLQTLKQLKQNLHQQNNKILKQQSIIRDINSDIQKKLKEYKQLLLKIGKCPTCLSNIDNMTIERIVNEFK